MLRRKRVGSPLCLLPLWCSCTNGAAVVSTAVSCETLLVFDSERGKASDLFTLDLATHGEVEIPSPGGPGTKNWLPDLSPGGAQVVFVSEDSTGAGQLHIANSDGSDPRQLTRQAGRYESPAWSPDGSWIAYEHGSEEGWGLYLIRPNGSDMRRIGPRDVSLFHPSWDPDGLRLAVVTGDEDGWVAAILTVESGALEQVTARGLDVGFVDWSPDGTMIALDGLDGSNFDLYLLDLESGNLDRLTDDPAVDARPTWSPDGTRLVFHSTRDRGGSVAGEEKWDEFELYLLDLGTGETERLTDNRFFDGHPDWCTPASASALDPGTS